MKILDQQDTGTCQKTLKIEVPRDEIAAQLDDVYKEFIQQATVPGFRKGKAPRSIVKMKFGKHLEGEAISKAVEDSYNKALEELNLHAVTQPEMDELEKDDEDQPITYTVKFEYIPEFPLSEYTDIQPELLSTEVAEADVVKSLDDLRERNASYVPIEDRGVKDQDFVTISCNATLDGEPFNEATHSEIIIEIGSKRYLAGFEEQVLGMKLEEEKTFTLTLPNDYPQEDKRGKEA
ncbi:MAG: trigger factor, partial [bacterium]|nr:trigger factor [bacterium]